MAIYRSEDNKPKHRPEFIYIDERKERAERVEALHGKKSEYFEKLQQMDNLKYPFVMRLLTFVWSLVFAFCALGMGVAVLAVFASAAICLFRWQKLNKYLKRLSDQLGKLLVFFLGTLIGTMAPPFGFGIIVLYYMLKGEEVENNIFMRFLHSR